MIGLNTLKIVYSYFTFFYEIHYIVSVTNKQATKWKVARLS